MYAIEFQAKIKNGHIQIPKIYRDRLKERVRVILMVDEMPSPVDMIQQLINNPLSWQILNLSPERISMPDADAGEVELCFVDTNVWLYAFIEGQDKSKLLAARQLLQDKTVVISTQVINEVAVNLLKKAQFSEAQLRLLIQSFYDKYIVVETSEELLLAASDLREKYQLSFWDSLIIAEALACGASVLYSEGNYSHKRCVMKERQNRFAHQL